MKFTVSFADPNPGDSPTVRADFTGFTYQDAAGHDVLLSPLAQQDVLARRNRSESGAGGGGRQRQQRFDGRSLQPCRQGLRFPRGRRECDAELRHHRQQQLRSQSGSHEAEVTFTIFGTNDVPVIADDTLAQHIHFAAGTSTSGGTLVTADATGGTYDFKDPDLTDTHWIIDANKDPAINPNANPNDSHRLILSTRLH